MKILITGSEGNIGKKLTNFLIEMGHDIYCVDIRQKYNDNYILCDITNPVELNGVFNKFKPDVVYHLAAVVSRVTSEKSPSICINTNISGTQNIIELCKQYNSKLIYFSTSEIYGDIGGVLTEDRQDIKPNNLYGLSKYLGEKLVEYHVENYGLKSIIVRPFMIYDEDETMGSHRSAMIRFAENLIIGNKITVHKNSKRSWMHISDTVKILEKLIYVDDFNIVNIGNPDIIDTHILAKKMCEYLNLKYDNLVIEEELPSKMTLIKHLDVTKQTKLTNCKCEVSVDDGIIKVIETMKKRI